MSNPPIIKQDLWGRRIAKYIAEFDRWKGAPDPKAPWESVRQGLFEAWEIDLLEKERLMLNAQTQYARTEDEMNEVNSNLGGEVKDLVMENILADLYEEVEYGDGNFEEEF